MTFRGVFVFTAAFVFIFNATRSEENKNSYKSLKFIIDDFKRSLISGSEFKYLYWIYVYLGAPVSLKSFLDQWALRGRWRYLSRNIKDITLMKNKESFVFLFYLILWRKANVECKFPQMERGNVRISGITTIFNLQLPPALCRQSRQSSSS